MAKSRRPCFVRDHFSLASLGVIQVPIQHIQQRKYMHLRTHMDLDMSHVQRTYRHTDPT